MCSQLFQDEESQVLGCCGRIEAAFYHNLERFRNLEPCLARFKGICDVHISHSLAKTSYGSEDIQVTVCSDHSRIRLRQAFFDHHVGTDPAVHIKNLDSHFFRELTTDLLVVRVFQRTGRHTEVKSEKSLLIVGQRRIPVFPLVVLDHVRAPKIPGRPNIQVHPDDLSGLDILFCVVLDDLFDDCPTHNLFIPSQSSEATAWATSRAVDFPPRS